jgi:hypothetical protein
MSTFLLYALAAVFSLAGFFCSGMWGYLLALEPRDPADARFGALGYFCIVVAVVLAGVA